MKIQEIEIKDPDNVFYPLNKECYEDISLVNAQVFDYHETIAKIEQWIKKET